MGMAVATFATSAFGAATPPCCWTRAGTRVLDDKPEPRRDDGGGLGPALDPVSSDPEPELLVAYRQALWQSES
jgi:hypothetical protein